ncbi:hypothetical protein ACFQV2_04715 [Actinokineospora soli]|uniref:Uncharacterized protein n=1 Tax=Actinokineospora soli TaxID=1048753 RepID=A0ABW2TJL1_9PSEU
MTSDVDKTLQAFRTRISDLESELRAEKLTLPPRLAAAAFAAALFPLTALPWVTHGSRSPETSTLWGLLTEVGFPAFVLVACVVALAGSALWAACEREAHGRVKLAIGLLTGAVVLALVWLSVQSGDALGESTEWWPAPWLVLVCAVGAGASTGVRER